MSGNGSLVFVSSDQTQDDFLNDDSFSYCRFIFSKVFLCTDIVILLFGGIPLNFRILLQKMRFLISKIFAVYIQHYII